MKVAFFTYPAAFQNIGGGEIQLLKTKQALEAIGQPVHFFNIWSDRVEHFDLLHIFSSVADCLGLAQTAKKRGVGVVVSPVLWSDFRRALSDDRGIAAKADLIARHAAKVVFPRFPSGRRKLLETADLLFPNSEAEKKQIAKLFGIDARKILPVPNGVDPIFAGATADEFRAAHGSKPFLLSVGRIEPRKNQLNLIRAVKKMGFPRLVLIGNPVTGYERYFEDCVKEGKGFAEFIGALNHESPMLRSAYAACEVFILQGWFETPGLVALEAALAGAKVLVTEGGSTREYFRDDAKYLNPSNPNDIAAKIQTVINMPKSQTLKKRVLDHYTWDKVAIQTRDAYCSLLGAGKT